MIKTLISLALMLYVQCAYGYVYKVESKEYSIETDKVAHITGPIDQAVQFTFKVEMRETENLPGARLIVIDSPGGDTVAGADMMMTMNKEKQKGVTEVCLVVGQASSMAFNFLTWCDIRLAVKGSTFKVHKIEYSSADSIIRSQGKRITATNLRQLARSLDNLDEPFRAANAKAMGLNLQDYDFCADKETVWRTGMLHVRKYLTGVATIK